MARYTKVGTSFRRGSLYNGSSFGGTRSDYRSVVGDNGTKVAGAIVNLPGGTSFRKSTELIKFRSWLEPKSPQFTRGVRTTAFHRNEIGQQEESAGGYFGDDFIRNSSATSKIANSSNAAGGCLKYGSDDRPYGVLQMKNEAVTKALLELANSKAGMGENLATFSQTIRMLRNPAQSLVRMVQLFKRDKHIKNYLKESYLSVKRRGVPKVVSEKYLEYVYGVKPLMQDIYGIIEFAKELGIIDHLLHGQGQSFREVAHAPQTFNNISGDARSSYLDGRERIHYRCSLWARIDPNYQGFRALNQLGLLNPLSLAWELTPLSFVIDWFVPIGPVLQALTAPVGLIFVDGTTSVRCTATGNIEHWGDTLLDGNYSIKQHTAASSTWRYEGYARSTLSTWPLPGLWIDSDPFRLNSGGDRWLKALALSIVRLR